MTAAVTQINKPETLPFFCSLYLHRVHNPEGDSSLRVLRSPTETRQDVSDQFGLECAEVAVIHGGRIRINNEDAAIGRFLLMQVDSGFSPTHAILNAKT